MSSPSTARYRGVFPVVPTIFDADGDIDLPGQLRCVDFMIDAGSKALTSDLVGLEGYGEVHSLNGARVYNMSEEHGFLDTARLNDKPKVGDLLRITPNHVCPVTNLFDKVVFVRGDEVLGAVKVDARGTVQ